MKYDSCLLKVEILFLSLIHIYVVFFPLVCICLVWYISIFKGNLSASWEKKHFVANRKAVCLVYKVKKLEKENQTCMPIYSILFYVNIKFFKIFFSEKKKRIFIAFLLNKEKKKISLCCFMRVGEALKPYCSKWVQFCF